MYFGRKRVQTGPNCSNELATFLKYHMPSNRKQLQIAYDVIFDTLKMWKKIVLN